MRKERSHSSSLTARQQQSGSSSKFSIIPNNGQSSPSLSLPLRPSLAPPRHMIFNPSSLFSAHSASCCWQGLWGLGAHLESGHSLFFHRVLLLLCVVVWLLFVSSAACDAFTPLRPQQARGAAAGRRREINGLSEIIWGAPSTLLLISPFQRDFTSLTFSPVQFVSDEAKESKNTHSNTRYKVLQRFRSSWNW